MNTEKAKWNPPARKISKKKSNSVGIIESLKVGDIIRIEHDDLKCRVGVKNNNQNGNCHLYDVMSRLRASKGWLIDMYHEKQGVCVVRRRAHPPTTKLIKE